MLFQPFRCLKRLKIHLILAFQTRNANDKSVKTQTTHVVTIIAACWRLQTFLKACSNEANIVQHRWANNFAQCWTKILSKFKLKPTSSTFQHGVQTRPTYCIQQCWMTLDQQSWFRLNRPLYEDDFYCGMNVMLNHSYIKDNPFL